ncbi:hypothetical protein KP509_23G017800 [Ceratopteris richardii]|uniref:Uncharacterized protein n=1 Tax=Ceratopteris richardii TaxID=49495 RepID=A0A8T2S035_CERRI|nr:hypothetical protein KP509_23G017800 [Ceratopteris richardii]
MAATRSPSRAFTLSLVFLLLAFLPQNVCAIRAVAQDSTVLKGPSVAAAQTDAVAQLMDHKEPADSEAAAARRRGLYICSPRCDRLRSAPLGTTTP